MAFRISGLDAAQFAALHGLSDAQLAAHGARRVVADRHPGFPCRVSLVDAQPGERVLLVNYEHLAVDSPYRARYAIYVREAAREAHLAVNEIPPVLHGRLIAVRAFSADGMLLDAQLASDAELGPALERQLASSAVAYLHLHNAKPGCYAARVARA
jgi:hypothetical protein